jgi:hypothetical protein
MSISDGLIASRPGLRTRAGSEVVGRGTTAGERRLLSFFVLWVGFGLAIDARKHNTEESLDTFFTSAHGLLYAGWFACATYLLYIARKRMLGGAKRFDAIPEGLVGASAGAALFGVAGLGDMSWHIKWGVEQGPAILFSPTHLGLMCSFLLLAFGPIRALWMDRKENVKQLTLIEILPAALSTAVVGFIFSVFLGFNNPYGSPGIFTNKIPLPIPDLAVAFTFSQIAGLLLFNVALFGSLLLLLRRWEVPFGAITILFAVHALCFLISIDFTTKPLMLAIAVAGLAMDVLWFGLRRLPMKRVAFRVFGFFSPLVYWGTYIAFSIDGRKMEWEREIWTGSLLWTAVIGLGISAVLLPPRTAPESYLD